MTRNNAAYFIPYTDSPRITKAQLMVFFTLLWCKSYMTYSVETLGFEFGSFQASAVGLSSLMCCAAWVTAAPRQPRDAEGRGPHSPVHCVASIFWIFVFCVLASCLKNAHLYLPLLVRRRGRQLLLRWNSR